MRTALACPEPPDRPLVAVYATLRHHLAARTVDTFGRVISSSRTTSGASWARLDLNTPEDRSAH